MRSKTKKLNIFQRCFKVKCRYCGKSFESKEEWKIHVLKKHTMVAIFGADILNPRLYDPMGLNKKVKRKRVNVEEFIDKIKD